MKKTITIILCLLAAIAVLVVGGSLLAGSDGNVHLFRYERQVTLTDEVLEPEMTEMQFTIDKGMEYELGIKWELSQPGILNGIRVINGQDEILFACTGECADIQSLPLYLEAGDYILETYYLTSAEDFLEFCKLSDIQLKSAEEAQYDYAAEGQWNFKYEFKVQKTGSNFIIIATVIGIVIGLLLTVILVAITRTNDTLKGNYDERQEMVRGKGFKYGFFTMLVCDGLLCIFDLFGLTWFAELEVAMFLSAIIGIIVYACYCILNDGYFALNENRKRLLICFAVIGVLNVLLGISNLCQGYGFVNGRLTIRSINLFCGVMALIVFFVILYKRIRENRED